MEKTFNITNGQSVFQRLVTTNMAIWSPPLIWEKLWGEVIPIAKNHGKSKLLEIGTNQHVWTCNDYSVTRSDMPKSDPRPQAPTPYASIDCNKTWPFKDGEFEVILSVDVIEHTENIWHFARESFRCSSRCVIIMTPNVETDLSAKLFLEKRYLQHFTPTDHVTSHHITPVFKWQFQRMASMHKWKIAVWEGCFLENGDDPVTRKGIIALGAKKLLAGVDYKTIENSRRVVRFMR